MIDRLLIPTLLLSSASTAAVTSVSPDPIVAVVGCACFSAFMVRAVVLAKPSKKRKAWTFEILVSVLTVFLAGVASIEYHLSIGGGAGVGGILGSLGAGVITIGRTVGLQVISNAAKAIIASTPQTKE